MNFLNKMKWYRRLINQILSPSNHVYCQRRQGTYTRELVLIFKFKDEEMALQLKKQQFKPRHIKSGMSFSIPRHFLDIITLSFAKDRESKLLETKKSTVKETPKTNLSIVVPEIPKRTKMKKSPTTRANLCNLAFI